MRSAVSGPKPANEACAKELTSSQVDYLPLLVSVGVRIASNFQGRKECITRAESPNTIGSARLCLDRALLELRVSIAKEGIGALIGVGDNDGHEARWVPAAIDLVWAL